MGQMRPKATPAEKKTGKLQELQNAFHWLLQTRGYQGKDHLMNNIDKLNKLAMDNHTELCSQKAD